MNFLNFQAVVFDFDGVILNSNAIRISRFGQVLSPEAMQQKLCNPDFLYPDTLKLIQSLSGKVPLHIASGAEHNELLWLCEKLELSSHFVSIHGGPTPKYQLLGQLLLDCSYEPVKTCLIGDSYSDYEAALENGMQFFGYANPKLKSLDGSSGWYSEFLL